MTQVYLTASGSMDPRTKIGSVLTFEGSVYARANSTVCGSPLEEYLPFMSKHEALEHAERLTIDAAAMSLAVYRSERRGAAHGAVPSISVNEIPCADCARAIVRAGIRRVYICAWWQRHVSEHGPDPAYKLMAARTIFSKNNVEFYLDDEGSSLLARRDDMDFRPNEEFFDEHPVL